MQQITRSDAIQPYRRVRNLPR